MSQGAGFLVAVATGGAIGAVTRYLVAGWITAAAGTHFPWGTLSVNVMGSFAMGIVYEMVVHRLGIAPEWRALLAVGFLGAFTTFSTFSIESLGLIQEGRWDKAVAYALASVVLCVLAAALGLRLSKLA